MLESELFGHARGAFTGAVSNREGLFQAAEGGTLFLDEIGDMPAPLQVKLLRVLQERKVRPLGSNRDIDIDVRIISATHRDLPKAMARGEFREDLYYRLNVVSLKIPALAERTEDIPLLANHLLRQAAERHKPFVRAFSTDAMKRLMECKNNYRDYLSDDPYTINNGDETDKYNKILTTSINQMKTVNIEKSNHQYFCGILRRHTRFFFEKIEKSIGRERGLF